MEEKWLQVTCVACYPGAECLRLRFELGSSASFEMPQHQICVFCELWPSRSGWRVSGQLTKKGIEQRERW